MAFLERHSETRQPPSGGWILLGPSRRDSRPQGISPASQLRPLGASQASQLRGGPTPASCRRQTGHKGAVKDQRPGEANEVDASDVPESHTGVPAASCGGQGSSHSGFRPPDPGPPEASRRFRRRARALPARSAFPPCWRGSRTGEAWVLHSCMEDDNTRERGSR